MRSQPIVVACAITGMAVWGMSQSTAPPTPAVLTPGTTIKADMSSSLSSANDQVGDQISATTTEDVKQGKITLPKGTTFSGHVTQVAPAPNGSEPGSIGVLFDQAVTSKGKTFSLLAGIASITPPKQSSAGPSRGYGGGRGHRGGGGYPGGGYPGGGGYPNGGGSSGSPGSNTPPPATPPNDAVPSSRLPADATKTGSILSTTGGNVWVAPSTHIVLQIIDPNSGAAASGSGAD